LRRPDGNVQLPQGNEGGPDGEVKISLKKTKKKGRMKEISGENYSRRQRVIVIHAQTRNTKGEKDRDV